MKLDIILSGSFCAILLCGTALAAPQAPLKLLVKPKAGASESALHAAFSAREGREERAIRGIGVRVVSVPAARAARLLEDLAAHPAIEYAEPDAVATAIALPGDPYFTSGAQWYLHKIAAPVAWDSTTGSSALRIAVIDTGVKASHPDLAGKVLAGRDFVNGDNDASDDNGHGTAVAGLIAASANNQLGMAGLCWSTPVLPVKVLGADGSGSYSAITSGIIWAADQGARVINLSLGGTTSSRALQDAVNYAWSRQVVVIAAAGNNGNSTPVYPAACSNVIAVSATDSADLRPSWSNYGKYVDLSAPGANVLTLQGSSSYAYWNGTSFSSPIVSGVVGLMISANSSLSNQQASTLLLSSCDDVGVSGYDVYYGSGRVNASRSVNAALAAAPVDSTPPVASILAPADGATVSGTISVSASGTDNVGVARMELLVNGEIVASWNSGAATIPWDTTTLQDGIHKLEARAYDAANLAGSKTISVTVRNSAFVDDIAPVTAITSPADGATVSPKSQKITVTASDNVKVVKIELFIDGKLVATGTSASLVFTWNTSKVARGAHVLQSYAHDAAGNIGASAPLNVYR